MSDQNTAPANVIAQIEDDDEETTHYICQTGSELTERDFDGGLSPPELLGRAYPGTPGTYLLLGDKRAFYCLNEKHFLQDFCFDDVEGSWKPGQLARLGAEGALDSEIAAAVAADGSIYVFYQSPSRAIRSLHCDLDGEWRSANDLPSTQPSDRVSIYAMTMDNTIRLFYTHQDNFIHELVFDGRWTDNRVDLSQSASQKNSILATPTENGEYTLQYTNPEREVYAIHNGELTLIGKYVNGVFEKDKDAEGWNSSGPKIVVKK